VIVVGGGPAGACAAATLRHSGRSVLLLEAEPGPAHKLCGEFLSPEAKGPLQRLGVLDRLWRRGAVPISSVRLTGQRGDVRGALPEPALGVSRYTLDELLLSAAREAGAHVRPGTEVSAIEGQPGGFSVRYTRDGQRHEACAALVVGAFGKRSRLGRALQDDEAPPIPGGGYVAFKAHYSGLDLGDTIELHAFPGGYCGMSMVEDGLLNLCLLVRTSALRAAGRSLDGLRRDLMSQNPVLRERLSTLVPAPGRVLAVSQISLRQRPLFSRGVMRIGDAAVLIAPLCGDGMAMALRGAELAAPLIQDYLSGALSPSALQRAYQRAFAAEFRERLLFGRALQAMLLRPRLTDLGLWLADRVPGLLPSLIRRTRAPLRGGPEPDGAPQEKEKAAQRPGPERASAGESLAAARAGRYAPSRQASTAKATAPAQSPGENRK
jgi:flavin-dependent dehydrogenase